MPGLVLSSPMRLCEWVKISHKIIDYLRKRSLRLLSPTINQTLPGPSLNPVPKGTTSPIPWTFCSHLVPMLLQSLLTWAGSLFQMVSSHSCSFHIFQIIPLAVLLQFALCIFQGKRSGAVIWHFQISKHLCLSLLWFQGRFPPGILLFYNNYSRTDMGEF